MDAHRDVARLLDLQDGVISRSQALDAGCTPTEIARRLRRRDWVVMHPGVYVDHTGPPTWRQRAWAAVLACAPAVLDGRSALRAHEGPGRIGGDDGPIQVLVAHGRTVRAPDGVVVRRSRRFAAMAQWNLSPPRTQYDETILELADRAPNDLAAIAVLADACGARRTSAARLRARLASISRLRRRSWLGQILDDLAEGTCSVLEQRYLADVERAHGLPRGRRQVAGTGPDGRRIYRDVVYSGRRPRWTQYVELDGRVGHSTARDRAADLDRDLAAAVDGEHTVRLGYGQVFDRACATAAVVARLLRARGWGGVPHPCPECPPEVRRLYDTWAA